MRAIHILFAAYQTDHGSNGGMESATRIFEALASDFRWTLLTNRESSRTARWRSRGAQVIHFAFDDAHRMRRAVQLAALGAISVREIAVHRAQIIHANDIRTAQVMGLVAGITQRQFLYTVRDTKASHEKYSPAWRRIVRKADRIVTLSNEMSQFISDTFDTPAVKLRTIHSMVDLETFRPVDQEQKKALRSALGIAPDEAAIGIVAGVVEKKAQLEFLRRTMPSLLNMEPRVRLHLIGDYLPESTAYARACEQVASQGSLDGRVIFHGFTAHVHSWLQALDVVVVPSRNEGLARCMIEAMACGVPVVSFDVCSAHEMLSLTGAGVVVPLGDYAKMSSAIARVLANPIHSERMGDVGRRTAIECFDASRIADQWRQVYFDLAGVSKQVSA